MVLIADKPRRSDSTRYALWYHWLRLCLSLLDAHSDLVGLYVSGGGVEGVIEALRHSERQQDIVVVCTDLTEATRAALVDEVVDVVLSHPREALAKAMIEAMAEHLHGGSGGGTQVHLLPFEIVTIESL